MSKTIIDVKHFEFRWSRITRNCSNHSTLKLTFLTTGIVSSLKQLLSDTDATVRHKTTEVLYIIAGHASGRDAFLDHEIITPLSKLVCK